MSDDKGNKTQYIYIRDPRDERRVLTIAWRVVGIEDDNAVVLQYVVSVNKVAKKNGRFVGDHFSKKKARLIAEGRFSRERHYPVTVYEPAFKGLPTIRLLVDIISTREEIGGAYKSLSTLRYIDSPERRGNLSPMERTYVMARGILNACFKKDEHAFSRPKKEETTSTKEVHRAARRMEFSAPGASSDGDWDAE